MARLAGVSDRTAAEALKGVDLYVDRDRLPPAAEGEFYHADLIGMAAVDPAGQRIGEIVAVQNFGAGDLLEIRLAGARQTELIPFTDASRAGGGHCGEAGGGGAPSHRRGGRGVAAQVVIPVGAWQRARIGTQERSSTARNFVALASRMSLRFATFTG